MPHHYDRPKSPTSSDSRATKRKSPAPTFINLDDCKPILSTTSTNTSKNNSTNASTAFVFTSSRTLRALQDQEDDGHRYFPQTSAPSSPSTPAASPTPDGPITGSQRASLTLSQLVRHSEGAVDARCLLGPKMRAAGFVNLPNSVHSGSERSCSSTPSPVASSSVSGFALPPMPSNPPNFPPIIFVNPTAITTTPLWEYQREMSWSLATSERDTRRSGYASSTGSTGSSEFTPGPLHGLSGISHASYAAAHHPRRPGFPPPKSSSSGSESTGLFSPASSSTLVSGSSTSTSMSSLSSVEEKLEEASRSGSRKGKARARDTEPTEFPFPVTGESPSSRGSRASSATASPSIISGRPDTAPESISSLTSPPRRPQAHTTRVCSPKRRQRTSKEKREKAKAKEAKMKAKPEPRVEPTPTFATAKPRPSHGRQFSLTELCTSSPFIWTAKSDVFAPPAPISRSPIGTSTTNSVASTPAVSRARGSLDTSLTQSHRHRRHHTYGGGSIPDPALRTHRIASAPLRLPPIPGSAPNSSSSDGGSDRSKKSKKTRAGAPKDHSHVLLPPAEIEALRLGVAGTFGTTLGPDTGGSGSGRRRGRDARGRDTRGKVLGASETAEERAAAEAEATMDKQKARALEELAAFTLTHSERGVVKEKHRAHHRHRKTLKDEYPPSESETTMVDHQTSALKHVA